MSDHQQLRDRAESWPVVESRVRHRGYIETVREDLVTTPEGGEPFERDVVAHLGAVAVIAIDADDNVLIVQQYRHPAQMALVEIPAGLRDAAGEATLATAKRELREEGFAEADRWTSLLEVFTTPGLSDERVEIFLAEDARVVGEAPGFELVHEEAHMTRQWVPFEALLSAVLDGRVRNAATCLAVTSVAARRARASDG